MLQRAGKLTNNCGTNWSSLLGSRNSDSGGKFLGVVFDEWFWDNTCCREQCSILMALTSAHNYGGSHSHLSRHIFYHIYFLLSIGLNGEHGRLGNESDYSPAKFSDGMLEVQSSSTCSLCCDLQGVPEEEFIKIQHLLYVQYVML
jgi:hypothetical protein